MIGETTMKCKYIDQKKFQNFKRKCALSSGDCLQLTVLILLIRIYHQK